MVLAIDWNSVTWLARQLAALDGLTVGIILLCSCVVWLLLNGGSQERKRRRLTGVTLPPGQSLDGYMRQLDKMHNSQRP